MLARFHTFPLLSQHAQSSEANQTSSSPGGGEDWASSPLFDVLPPPFYQQGQGEGELPPNAQQPLVCEFRSVALQWGQTSGFLPALSSEMWSAGVGAMEGG